MRRTLAAAALIGAFLLTGCSSDGDAAPAPAAAPPPAPGAPAGSPSATADAAAGAAADADAKLRGNTQAICDQAVKTGGDFAATFTQNLKLQIDAASGDDPVAVQRAKEKSARDVQSYSYALKDMSKLAADAEVSKALSDMSKEVTALKGDVRKLDAKKLAELRAPLDKACGKD